MPRTSVSFVVTELLGTVRNGGIATATSHAALVLAQHGYDVELLYCGHATEVERAWAHRYADSGVRVRWLDRQQQAGPPMAADAYRVASHVQRTAPDVVVVQDWLGLGCCVSQLRRAGELPDTKVVHICHGPTLWLHEANRRLDLDADAIATAAMERTSAEGADAIVSPSRHLLEWMERAGWTLPKDQAIIPYFTEGHVERLDRPLTPDPPLGRIREVVFFGRLEERKGVHLFVDALRHLDPRAIDDLTVTFLGRAATITPRDVEEALPRRVRDRLADLRFEGDLDQAGARAYLRAPGRLAVIPSLLDNSPNVIYECIEDRVPFLASDAGGNAELVDPADRAAVLFAPTVAALTERLAAVLAAGSVPRPARPAYDGTTSLEAWRSMLDAPRPGGPEITVRELPPVSVVVAHHDGGRHLREAIESVAGQEHAASEVIVVDDGSTDRASIAELEEIESAQWPMPLRVIRQPNRYLGAARNTGMREAASPLVAFLDDDDVLHPSFLRTLARTAERTGATAVASTLLAIDVDENGELGDPARGVAWVFLAADAAAGVVWNTFGGAGAVVRRDRALEVGAFHERRGVGHEDWALLARLALADEPIVHVPMPLYRYRIRPGSMIRTTSTFANLRPVFDAYRDVLPAALRWWPDLVRGQHEVVRRQAAELESVRAHVDALALELERRKRWFELLDGQQRG